MRQPRPEWGKPGQVIGHAANQRDPIGLRRMGNLGDFQVGQDEPVDRVPGPPRLSHRGRLRPFQGLVSPVLFLLGREGLEPGLSAGSLPFARLWLAAHGGASQVRGGHNQE